MVVEGGRQEDCRIWGPRVGVGSACRGIETGGVGELVRSGMGRRHEV